MYINGWINVIANNVCYKIRHRNIVKTKVVQNKIEFKYCLFNIVDGQILQLTSDLDRMTDMIKYLIMFKYFNKGTSDTEFMKDVTDTYNKYYVNNRSIEI
jgi:hypothetical protein